MDVSRLSSRRRMHLGRESATTIGASIVTVAALSFPIVDRGAATTIGLATLAIAALLLRHRAPLLALALVLAAWVYAPQEPVLMLPVLLIIYRAGLERTWPPLALASLAGSAAVSLALLCWRDGATDQDVLLLASRAVAQAAAAAALGLYLGARRAQIRALEARNQQLASERDLLTDRAVAEERLRIARELHDVVAHSVSLMVVKSQALGMTAGTPEVREATDAIADLGRDAMGEMDRTLRLLRVRGAEAEREPQPGLDQLPPLLERSRQAGVDVELVVEGEPRSLSQSADLSAFRIVQEALTNVLKHAGGAATTVTLLYSVDRLDLRITNDGPPLIAPVADGPSRAGPGHGLTGMRERAALFGGTVTASPTDGRGFEVRATLPDGDRSW